MLIHVDDDDLGIEESKELCISKILANKIEHAFFDTFADKIGLHKIMKNCFHSQNLTLHEKITFSCIWTEYGYFLCKSVNSVQILENTVKIPYMDTFHAVLFQ